MSIPISYTTHEKRTEVPYSADLCEQFLAWDSFGSLLCMENPRKNPADVLCTHHSTLLAHLPTILKDLRERCDVGSDLESDLGTKTTLFLEYLFDTYFGNLPPTEAWYDEIANVTHHAVFGGYLTLYTNLLECCWLAPQLWLRVKPLLGLCLECAPGRFSVADVLVRHPKTPRFVLGWIVEAYRPLWGRYWYMHSNLQYVKTHRQGKTLEEVYQEMMNDFHIRHEKHIENWRIPSKLDARYVAYGFARRRKISVSAFYASMRISPRHQNHRDRLRTKRAGMRVGIGID